MQSRAIQLVTRAIATRIEAALSAIPNYDKVVVGAPNSVKAMRAQVVVFPYRVIANSALRNVERILPPTDAAGAPLLYEEALPLDVFYLLTVGSVSAEPPDAQIALQETFWESLGRAITALQSAPALVGEAVEGDTVRLSLEPVTADEMSRIWALFPTTDYRTSVIYVASPVWIDVRAATEAGPVVDDRQNIGQRAA